MFCSGSRPPPARRRSFLPSPGTAAGPEASASSAGGLHQSLTRLSSGADGARPPLRALNSSRPDAIREHRRAARCRSSRSGRAGCPGSSVGIEFETLLRMTVSSLFRPCAAAAAMAHTRSVFNKRSTQQSSWAVVIFRAAGTGVGFGIKEMATENICDRKPANGEKRRVGFFFSVDSDT